MLDIGILIENWMDDGVEWRSQGPRNKHGIFKLRCDGLGLVVEAEGCQNALAQMKRLRLEELTKRLAERPENWELRMAVKEAEEDGIEDADEIIEVLASDGSKFSDEIDEGQAYFQCPSRPKAAKEWRAANRRAEPATSLVARTERLSRNLAKKVAAEKKEKPAA